MSHGYSLEIKADVHIIDRIVRDDYEWLKGDKTVKEDQRLNRFVIEDTHMLKITGVVPEDSGLYKLKASGKAGSVEREFDVQISGIVSSCSVHSLAPNYNH